MFCCCVPLRDCSSAAWSAGYAAAADLTGFAAYTYLCRESSPRLVWCASHASCRKAAQARKDADAAITYNDIQELLQSCLETGPGEALRVDGSSIVIQNPGQTVWLPPMYVSVDAPCGAENFIAIKVPKFNEAAFCQVARSPIDDTLAAFELGPEHLYSVLKNAMAPLWMPSDVDWAAMPVKSNAAA